MAISSRIRELPMWLAMFLIPVALTLHQWNPCDSTASVAAGDSLVHIGLCLAIGLLVAVGKFAAPWNLPTHRRDPWDPWCFAFWFGAMVFCAWLAVVTWSVVGRGNARHAVNGFWQWNALLVLGASIASLTARPRFSEHCLAIVLAIAMGVVAYGFWEYGVMQPALRAQLQQDPAGLFRREGIAIDSGAGMLLADRIRSTEMRSTFALANSLGGYLASIWVLLVGLGLTSWQYFRGTSDAGPTLDAGSGRRTSQLWMIALAIACGLVAIALLLTKSRTAWLAAGLGTICLGIAHGVISERGHARWIRLRWLAALTAVIALAGVGAVAAFDPLILREAGKSLAYRWDYWQGAMALIAERPWLGYGCGNFQSSYLTVKLPTAAESPADPHNFLLEIAHAGGLILFLIASACGFVWVVLGFRTLRKATPSASPVASRSSQRMAPSRVDSRFFWSGAIASAVGVLGWNFFTAGDSQLAGASLSVVAASLFATLLARCPSPRGIGFQPVLPHSQPIATAITRCPPPRASVQLLVQNHREYLWIAMGTLGVHWLASGGWMLPGTMALAMVLLGLGFQGQQAGGVTLGRGWTWGIAAGLSVVLLAGWYTTMAMPLASGIAELTATFGSNTAPSVAQVRALADADRLDPELPRLGMEWCAEELERPIGGTSRTEREELLKKLRKAFLDRDPGHALAFETSGRVGLRAAAAQADPGARAAWLRQADEDLQNAAMASPASAQGHVQAAVASHLAGDDQRALQHCDAAQAIDTATPHRDRKIQAAQVFWPRALEPENGGLPFDARQGIPKDFVRAEPVVRYLRSLPKP